MTRSSVARATRGLRKGLIIPLAPSQDPSTQATPWINSGSSDTEENVCLCGMILGLTILPDRRTLGTMVAVSPKQILDAFEPILGCPAWQVEKGHASFLTMEFGEPQLEIREPKSPKFRNRRLVTIRGEWHLWIYCCGWNIAQDGERLAHYEAEDETIREAAAQLDGQCLERLWLEPGTVITHFEFDLGAVLTTYPLDDDPDMEQWILYEPSGDVLTVRADNRFCHRPGDTPPDEEIWLPLLSMYET